MTDKQDPTKKYGEFDPRGWPKWLSVSSACVGVLLSALIIGALNVLILMALGGLAYWVKLEIAGQIQDRKKLRAKKPGQ